MASFAPLTTPTILEQLERWRPDGVITCHLSHHLRLVKSLLGLGCPLVNASQSVHGLGASAASDPTTIANLAVKHFRDTGVERVAYVALWNEVGLAPIGTALEAVVGGPIWSYEVTEPYSELANPEPQPSPALQAWLAGLPAPVGLLCESEFVGAYLLRACRTLHLAVPERISIIACGEEDAPSSNNSVSAVQVPYEAIGLEAARLLDRILGGEAPSQSTVLVPVTKLVGRSSTRSAVLSSNIFAALDYIERNACRGITVTDVLAEQPVSRVTFERHFRSVTGRSPGEEIRRVRLEHAKRLLRQTGLPAATVAHESGFSSATTFSLFFKKATGLTPIAYRNQHLGK